ncbi:MAG: NAD(P)/FAD-dependent oxidoreductase [Candidatus Aminicenantes bacterium]|nr:NAD(P)/FAD-dependent oxidoreductase [Candidatus Aminicenantes bacterium]
MRYDVIVVGAGLGGLTCAALLTQKGLRVLVLDKDLHPGGTSYVFQRGAYKFPMGPLSFSYPGYVSSLLASLGLKEPLEFQRNHFQLIAGDLDLVYSVTPKTLQQELAKKFPREADGLETFFQELEKAIKLVHDIYLWHPDYLPEKLSPLQEKVVQSEYSESRKTRILSWSHAFSGDVLRKYLKNKLLVNFLGSMGTGEPVMSFLTLAVMWNIMSVEGIWYPSWGIQGISDRLAEIIRAGGGGLWLGMPVKRIVVENGQARGIMTADDGFIGADWIVSNADFKTTFLELIESAAVPGEFLERVRNTPYTGSELCVYLGVEAEKIDLSQMRATHLFYCARPGQTEETEPRTDGLNLESKEIEVCRWTDNEPGQAPPGYVGLILRVGFDYDHFARFRTGEKKRAPEYRAYKTELALKLVRVVENIIPGLSGAIELMEVATPLTYQDWGHRYQGSIAGWSWGADWTGNFGRKLLVETPVRNLLTVGIYAASELFMGGVPTAMRTGELAARLILENKI